MRPQFGAQLLRARHVQAVAAAAAAASERFRATRDALLLEPWRGRSTRRNGKIGSNDDGLNQRRDSLCGFDMSHHKTIDIAFLEGSSIGLLLFAWGGAFHF
jgi:hypothetical protein